MNNVANMILKAGLPPVIAGFLEASRPTDPADKDRKLLLIASLGKTMAIGMKRAVSKTQQRILVPQDVDERVQLSARLTKLVSGHEDLAP
jgi:hypothetical protein